MTSVNSILNALSQGDQIKDFQHASRLFIDNNLKSCVKIYAHPLVNDRTLELSIVSLELFFSKVGATVNWVDL